MKKNILILLSVIMIFSTAFTLCACELPEFLSFLKKEEQTPVNENDFVIMSDIHVLSSKQYGTTVSDALAEVLSHNEKTVGLTEAVFKTAIDDFIASDKKILIITGDLTDDGAKVAHEFVSSQLQRAEDAGKRCYVINGNHDLNNNAYSYAGDSKEVIDHLGPDGFLQLYNHFGYDEALAKDEGSLSYTADLTSKYRLVAIDCSYYQITPGTLRQVEGRHDPHVTDELLAWVETQLSKCAEDGKIPFIITHFPILSHIGSLVGSMSYINKQEEMLSTFEDGNVAFSFCGHVHQQDIASYTFYDKTYYEIETGSLSFTTLPIRNMVDDGQTVTITTSQQSHVNADYIPAFYSAEEKERIVADLTSYVKSYELTALGNHFYGKLHFDTILSYLGITDEDFIEELDTTVTKYFLMPFYKQEGKDSVEALCEKYGVSDFPKIDGVNCLRDLLSYIVYKNFAGDESTKKDDPAIKQLRYSLYGAVAYLAEYGLATKFHEQNDSIRAFSMQGDIQTLFNEGKLEISKNGFLGILADIPKIQRLIQKVSILENLISEDSVETAENLKSIIELLEDNPDLFVGDIGDLINSFKDENGTFSKLIDFTKYDSEQKAYLNLGGIVDILVDSIGNGLLNDEGPADNNITFPSPTLAE